MGGQKASGSKSHIHTSVAPAKHVTLIKDGDGSSSLTSVTIDSDSDASSVMTLVDIFPDLALVDDDGDGDTSAESTNATSSQLSSSANDESSTDARGHNQCLKMKPGGKAKCVSQQNGDKGRSTHESESESTGVDTSEEESTSEGAVSSDADSSEAAVDKSTTSGGSSLNDNSSVDETSTSRSVDGFSSAQSSMQSANPGNWTPSEDALIISMKEGGESWAEIGTAINRGKNEVKKRWHVVKANNANSKESKDGTDDRATDKKSERKKSKDKEKRPQTSESPKLKTKTKTKDKDKDKEPKKKQRSKAAQDSSSSAPTASTTDSKEEEDKDDDENDASSISYRDRINLLQDTSLASESAPSTTDGGADADPDALGYYEREFVRQERYIRRHVHPALYPVTTTGLPPPPRVFRAPSPADKQQRRDDAILAAVASRREATRWLEMQANFYNVTGRMVPLHLIKARCEAEEDRGKEAAVRSWTVSVAGSDGLLDPHERGDVPDDAIVSVED